MSVRAVSVRVMTVVYPPEPEPAPTPEEALELTGFYESSVEVPRDTTGGHLPVRVRFGLSRPPSETEVLIIDDHTWGWRALEGQAELVVDGFNTRDIERSLREVRIRLADVTEAARDLEARRAAVVSDVTLSLGIELRKL